MVEDDCMDMTVSTRLSSQLRLVLLVVANFSERKISELNTRTRAKLDLRVPKLYVPKCVKILLCTR